MILRGEEGSLAHVAIGGVWCVAFGVVKHPEQGSDTFCEGTD